MTNSTLQLVVCLLPVGLRQGLVSLLVVCMPILLLLRLQHIEYSGVEDMKVPFPGSQLGPDGCMRGLGTSGRLLRPRLIKKSKDVLAIWCGLSNGILSMERKKGRLSLPRLCVSTSLYPNPVTSGNLLNKL